MSQPDPASIESTVIDALLDVAPDLERGEIRRGIDLRQDLDIDSMDFLNFIIRLHERYGIEIPEADYPRFATLEGCVAYVSERLAAPPA